MIKRPWGVGLDGGTSSRVLRTGQEGMWASCKIQVKPSQMTPKEQNGV